MYWSIVGINMPDGFASDMPRARRVEERGPRKPCVAAKVLRPEGRLVIIGLSLGTLPVSFFALPYGAEVATSYWGTVTELMELVSLARARKIRLDVEAFPLDKAPEVYERLRRGEVKGRAVIVPNR